MSICPDSKLANLVVHFGLPLPLVLKMAWTFLTIIMRKVSALSSSRQCMDMVASDKSCLCTSTSSLVL